MHRTKTTGLLLAAALFALTAKAALAQKIMLRNFDNPCGIAVQPETGHVFVAQNKRIVRLVPDGKRFKRSPEVIGFPTDIYGKGPKYEIGPLGLAFHQGVLVVGGGGLPDGQELMRTFKVGNEPPEKPQRAKSADSTAGPIKPSEQTQKGEGNFYALAIIGDNVFITCNGDDTKGWVSKAKMKEGKLTSLEPCIATKVATNVDAPTAATATPDGKLMVGQLGEITVPGDSLLTIYDPESGELEVNVKTRLFDLVALAYSPKTGKLYGLDYAWMKPDAGGLFEITLGGGGGATTKKIADIDKPTAMAFAEDGTLYVTAIGTPSGKKNKKGKEIMPGHVLRFEGL